MKAFVIFAALSVCAYAVSGEEAKSYQHREDRNIPIAKDLHIPNYKYEYGVKDPKTGDHKAAWEVRNGDYVKGGYMLQEPDGTMRVVEYEADPKHGFRANVKRIGKAFHPRRLNREKEEKEDELSVVTFNSADFSESSEEESSNLRNRLKGILKGLFKRFKRNKKSLD